MNYIKNSDEIEVKPQNVATSMEEILNFCFPSGLFSSPFEHAEAICNNAILCPTNAGVNEINEWALKQMQGQLRTFISIDSPLDSGDPRAHFSSYRADYNLESIHHETPTGLPPHELKLKVNCF